MYFIEEIKQILICNYGSTNQKQIVCKTKTLYEEINDDTFFSLTAGTELAPSLPPSSSAFVASTTCLRLRVYQPFSAMFGCFAIEEVVNK